MQVAEGRSPSRTDALSIDRRLSYLPKNRIDNG